MGQWLSDNWPAVGLGLLAFSTVGLLYQRYTKETVTSEDDRIGDIVGHLAGFAKFLLLVVRGKR